MATGNVYIGPPEMVAKMNIYFVGKLLEAVLKNDPYDVLEYTLRWFHGNYRRNLDYVLNKVYFNHDEFHEYCDGGGDIE
ncbi:unnamed protein product, partial [Sphagnum compactum]